MMTNPVFREGIQIYLIEGHGFVAYFHFMILLAGTEFLTLFLPSLDPQVWIGPANLFRVSTVAALILISYFVLKVANQELVPWRFLPLKRRLRQEGLSNSEVALGQLALLGLHALLFVLVASPLLIWAGAIARTAPAMILSTLLLLFFYALTCGVWGVVALALGEHRVEGRQVFVRSLFIALIFLSALLYLPLNPIVFVLSYLGKQEVAVAAHFLFHFFVLGSGLIAHRWALSREDYR